MCCVQGFLPESADQFARDVVYPAFSPSVGVFLALSTLYGIWKVPSQDPLMLCNGFHLSAYQLTHPNDHNVHKGLIYLSVARSQGNEGKRGLPGLANRAASDGAILLTSDCSSTPEGTHVSS